MRTAIADLVSLLAPPRCAACGAQCDPRALLCEACESALARSRPLAGVVPGVDVTWSAAPYIGVARGIVTALKFRRLLPVARRAAAAIQAAAPEQLDGPVVPVPAAPLRLRWRGFDPAEEIALELARLCELPFDPCLRRDSGRQQVGRRRGDRLASPPRVGLRSTAPGRALLVDDVLTTGATLEACARALRQGGCRRVVAVTFARSERALDPTAPQYS